MTMTKPIIKTTYREYLVLGDRLKRLHVILMKLSIETCKRDGKRSKAAENIRIAMKGLDTARSLLEDDFFRDYPECAGIDVFYGDR